MSQQNMLFGEKRDWPWPNFSETRETHQEPPEDITSVGAVLYYYEEPPVPV
jgi:hypothetical protein